jgi:hypothetical protein
MLARFMASEPKVWRRSWKRTGRSPASSRAATNWETTQSQARVGVHLVLELVERGLALERRSVASCPDAAGL